MKKHLWVFLCGLAMVAGCGTAPQPTETASDNVAVDGAKFLIDDEPAGARDVIVVRESAGDGDDVLLVGRIGGAENPWVEGRAAFTVVDRSLKACTEIPGDNCPTPWDYCCATDLLPGATAFVKVVDEHGVPVEADARKLLKVKELSQVVVQGKAQRDEAGNLTVLATGIYVKP